MKGRLKRVLVNYESTEKQRKRNGEGSAKGKGHRGKSSAP